MLDFDQIDSVLGREVTGPDGKKIGQARQVFADDETGRPTWVSVETGLLGNRASFIPLDDASVVGDHLEVPYDNARVKGAPDHLGEGDHLSPDDEEVLYRYYRGERGERGNASTTGTAGFVGDRAGRDDDDAMTVSEEQLAVSTRSVARERVRLRKSVVTEEVTLTVTVRKERFTVDREPIADDGAVSGTTGTSTSAGTTTTDFADSDIEIVLYEEVPVVQKVVRPVERIRLVKEVATTEETVSGEVRKERVDVEDLPLEGERRV